jgi:hypothetical protein
VNFDAANNSLCDGITVNATDYAAAAAGPCSQECAGGEVVIGGGESVSGSGGDLVISGGSTASSNPGSTGGDVRISGGSGRGVVKNKHSSVVQSPLPPPPLRPRVLYESLL